MWGGTEEKDAVAAIQAAVDMGINLVDTAPVYGSGLSEELVGRALADGSRRSRTVLATKWGLTFETPPARDSTPERLQKEVEDSLRRLRTDHIDIYQVHWPDLRIPIEQTAEAMARLHRSGKIRALGVSNYSPEQMSIFQQAAPLHTSQPPYNLFERGIEDDVLPYCREHGIAVLAYGALCRGLLTGKMTPDTEFVGDDLRQVDPKFQQPRYGQYLAAVAALDRFAQERYGKRVIHLAARWLLDQPGMSVALWGARRPDQLDPVTEAFGWSLDDEAKAQIDAILADNINDPVGPEFMAPPTQ
jgi:aryl-alcohol dehydrogenase-like predicted oxidoreductase